jgi:glycosyltransferase involved in cell wall biosynthesis
MKILYLLHNDPRATGGTEKHALQLATTAAANGHDVAFFYPRVTKQEIEPSIEESTSGAIRFIELKRQVHNNFLPPGPFEKQLNQIFGSVLESYKPDVIHIHHLKNLPSGCLPTSLICGARVVFSLQDYEFFCLQTHLVRGNGEFCPSSGGGESCAVHCLPKALRAKAVITQPFKSITGEPAFVKYLRATISNRQIAFKKIHCTLAASQYVIDRFKKEGFESPNMRLLELGINYFEAPLREPAKRPVRFLFLGNVNHEKGVDLLLDAFKQLKPEEATLTIYGGFVSKEAQPLLDAAKNSLPHVKYAGPYEENELPAIFAETDCLINPTRRLETFSLVLSEAWMAKTPVISAASGALATRINHGVNGLLFNPGDLKTMMQHIKYVIDKPEALETLRGRIPEVMTIDRYYKEIERIYKNEDSN